MQTKLAFNAEHQNTQFGTIPPLPGVWKDITGGGAAMPPIEVVTEQEVEEFMRRQYNNADAGTTVKLSYDAPTGQIGKVEAGASGSPATLGEFTYDAFGRRTGFTDYTGGGGGVASKQYNDWLSGEMDFIHTGSGGSNLGYSHGPGLSRLRDAAGSDQAFYARGPQGQVRWTVGADGGLNAAYTYNAWPVAATSVAGLIGG